MFNLPTIDEIKLNLQEYKKYVIRLSALIKDCENDISREKHIPVIRELFDKNKSHYPDKEFVEECVKGFCESDSSTGFSENGTYHYFQYGYNRDNIDILYVKEYRYIACDPGFYVDKKVSVNNKVVYTDKFVEEKDW